MTREQVARACGLDDPHEYIRRTGIGRTVAMLCNAVAAASLGQRVLILAFQTSYAQRLAVEARRMAQTCGIFDALFEAMSFDRADMGGLRGRRDEVILRDHYRGL